MYIASAEKKDYSTLIEIWQDAVSQTHDFLSQHHIDELKALILEHYFDAVTLYCCKNHDDKIAGLSALLTAILKCCLLSRVSLRRGGHFIN